MTDEFQEGNSGSNILLEENAGIRNGLRNQGLRREVEDSVEPRARKQRLQALPVRDIG